MPLDPEACTLLLKWLLPFPSGVLLFAASKHTICIYVSPPFIRKNLFTMQNFAPYPFWNLPLSSPGRKNLFRTFLKRVHSYDNSIFWIKSAVRHIMTHDKVCWVNEQKYSLKITLFGKALPQHSSYSIEFIGVAWKITLSPWETYQS